MFDYYFVGIIQLIIGLFFTFSPPKKPNDLYGYWGKGAKRSYQHWRLAHNTAGPLFIIAGVISSMSGYHFYDSAYDYARTVNLFIGLGLGATVILITEWKLRNFKP